MPVPRLRRDPGTSHQAPPLCVIIIHSYAAIAAMKSGRFIFFFPNNMSERPPKPENPRQETAKQETELSPEIIEMIMEKVQDIKKDGIAFTTITGRSLYEMNEQEQLRSILEHGLLGGPIMSPRVKTKWTQELKKKGRGNKAAPVFFNISGRSLNSYPDTPSSLRYLRPGDRGQYGGVTILFDLTKFKEVGMPLKKDYGEGEDRLNPADSPGYEAVLKPYTFWVTQPENSQSWMEKQFREVGISEEDIQEAWQPGSEALKGLSKKYPGSITPEGLIQPDGEYGFVLSYRIAPKLFEGFVVSTNKEEEAIKAAMLDLYKESPDFLVPIYDNFGDVIWPKKISHRAIREGEEKK